jgi:hypothetical protein
MKTPITLIMILLSAAVASDLSGKWSGHFKADGADHDVPQLFILQQQGTKLTGSGGPNEGEQYPIENGNIEGDEAKFELTTGEWKFTYRLKRTGQDELQGDIKLEEVGDRRTAKVSLRRVNQK